MVYKVIQSFFDLKDDNYKYEVGDTFPRKGNKPTSERVESLLSSNNPTFAPFISEVKKSSKKAKEDED